jgi:hypothetical protein
LTAPGDADVRRRIENEPSDPLPTHGLEVVEVRDVATLRSFMREWHRLVRATRRGHGLSPGAPPRRIENRP